MGVSTKLFIARRKREREALEKADGGKAKTAAAKAGAKATEKAAGKPRDGVGK